MSSGDYCQANDLAPADLGGLEDVIQGIVNERLDFVKERGMGAMGPLMGVVMQAAGGADGKEVSVVASSHSGRVGVNGHEARGGPAGCARARCVVPHASAEPWALEWEQDVGPGYITTSPLVDEERVYVRTSGFWTGEERPEVMAFTHQGALEWSYSSPTTVQHDMAPMLKVGAGSGPCGSWPDLLLVGWADGAFTALHPSNGTLHWQANSNVRWLGHHRCIADRRRRRRDTHSKRVDAVVHGGWDTRIQR